MPANGQAMREGLVIMARRRAAWTFSRGAAIALVALGLVACGETAAPVDPGTQELRSDVKGVTKHLYEVSEGSGAWRARVVLDV